MCGINKVVFGAISLDLAAVILGGARALFPAYARGRPACGDPKASACLQAGPAVGATVVGLYLAAHPIRRRAGGDHVRRRRGLWRHDRGVRRFPFVVGVGPGPGGARRRGHAERVRAPDPRPADDPGRHARPGGRGLHPVQSVRPTSWGEFESGIAARLLGVVGAAVFGGVGAMIVTGLWARLFPDLRRADRLQ